MIQGIICGPTGIGKSMLALNLAEANGFEIISADSRQVYRNLEIGTGQAGEGDLSRVPHH
ncbi:MAG: tRNA dimethylallyltransferase, partial [Nitrospinae bacterium]|nr:tRNA dimethylallyltransferase [Nitrospinota bacterium]